MGSNEPLPVRLYQSGFRDLVSVIPPDAILAPSSRISTSQLGKTPGLKYPSGTWGGYPWVKHEPTEEDVRKWCRDGANIGLKGTFFPGLDIDCLDPWIANEIVTLARRHFGPAPKRTGRAPKSLLMYRAFEPFARMAVILKRDEKSHLVEMLGQGRQYLIAGTHPSGVPYTWDTDIGGLTPDQLTPVTRDQVESFFTLLGEHFDVIGIELERVGDGKIRSESTVSQDGLKAPSMEVLEECVAAIPNSDAQFPDRDDYIKVGYAIKAAGQEDEERAYACFAEWAAKWDGGDNHPELVREDWRRMKPPYAVGYGWLAELARRHGWNDAQHEFEADEAKLVEVREAESPPYSDEWLANRVILDIGNSIRYAPALGTWYVWGGGVWQPDSLTRAEYLIGQSMKRMVPTPGGSAKEQAKAEAIGMRLCSTATQSAVRQQVERDPRVAVDPGIFDRDPMLINTPGGVVDLRTGEVKPHDPELMCSKITSVAPDPKNGCPMWRKFLGEITLGDKSVEEYLQRLAGYCLTGLTVEQKLFFLWGPGGNGKGAWLRALLGIMSEKGGYASTAPMDSFTATTGDRHPTDIAGLMGARLVMASETTAGRRWDEARVKSLTGGDPISARKMRQDFFTFMPQFKLVFIGNHKPEIRDLDKAMKRRIHLLHLTFDPPVVDLTLEPRLEAEEWPAIFSWAIEGCLKWQQSGLQPPAALRSATEEYFVDQDPVGRWLEEGVEKVEGAFATTQELFDGWRQWANQNGEYPGNTRRLGQQLAMRKLESWRDPETRRKGFKGLRVRPWEFTNQGEGA